MIVIYNGIRLEIVHTKSMTRLPLMSDDGTELRAMKYVYELICMYNTQATSYESNSTQNNGVFPAATDVAIRYALLEPRKQLVIKADDSNVTVVLESPAPGYDLDADNGPKPLYCNVIQINPATWSVAWGIETTVIECPELSSSTSPITSTRFSQTQHTGDNHLTTITTKGITSFRTDQLDDLNLAADFFRNAVIPGVPLNFRRMSVDVMVASPGNLLAWTVTDQEMFNSIGGTDDARRMGVVDFKDMFSSKSAPKTETGVPTNYLICQCDIMVQGNQQSTLQGLFNWCAAFVIERCAIPNGPVDFENNALILHVSTQESLKDKTAGLHVTFQLPPAKGGLKGFGPLNASFIGVDIINMFANNGQNPQMPNDSNTRGTFNSQLFVQAIKDACSAPFDPPTKQGSPVGTPDDNYLSGSPTTVDVYPGTLPPYTSTNYSDDACTNGTYNEMTIESKYTTDQGLLAMPIASSGSSSYQSGSDSRDDSGDVAIVAVSNPITYVEYEFEAERSGTPPLVPDPCSYNANLVLLWHQVSPVAVGLAPDGVTSVFRIGGKYKYVCKKARKPTDPVPFGVHPFTNFIYTDDANQFTSFTHGLLDSSDGSDGGDGGGDAGDGGGDAGDGGSDGGGSDGGGEPSPGGPDGPTGPSE